MVTLDKLFRLYIKIKNKRICFVLRSTFRNFAPKYEIVMALNPNKSLKKYFAIGEVAEMFGVTETLLRYWEKEFPSIQPRKSGRNVRQYTQEDIDEIRVIHNLVKVRGMKLAAAREAIAKNRSKENSTTELMERLLAIRAELVSIKKEFEGIV